MKPISSLGNAPDAVTCQWIRDDGVWCHMQFDGDADGEQGSDLT